MDMVRVDPKLFATCRLCVENMGMYQITPMVQEQIKYCFDIEVSPFDGLPQLICDVCEGILSEYHTNKKIFIGKQNALKARLQLRKELESTSKSPKHDLVRTSHGEIQERASPVDKLQRSISVAPEQHPVSVESEASSDTATNAKAGPASYKKICANKKSKSWEASYNKVYVCRLCDKQCKSRGNINLHFKKHRGLINNNRDIFKKYCTIDLNKLDSKLNITGNKETVVLNQNKITRDEGKMHYYVLYTLNEEFREVEMESDSSDDFAPKVQGKRRRLLSRSSNDTVILNDAKTRTSSDNEEEKKSAINNDKEENVPNVMECIDLDDSSDESIHNDTTMPSTSNMNLRNTTENKCPLPQLTDHKTISNIVSACQNKYLKKIECSEEQEKQFESNKSKLLNIGLKSIFQQCYKSNGLLRYLEHDHLEIKWIPINSILRSQSKENKYVRIMPRVKGKEDYDQDDAQWNKITNFNIKLMKDEVNKPIQVQKRKSLPIIESLLMSNTSTSSVVNGHSKSDQLLSDCAVLYSNTSVDADKKLLNASPVANPKQLPKKVVQFETKVSPAPIVTEAVVVTSPVVQDQSHSNTQPMLIDDAEDLTNEDNDVLCMPIITSTTSLAPGNVTIYNLDNTARKEENNATCITNNVNSKSDGSADKSPTSPSKTTATLPSNKSAASVTPAPRIKVKNVAELMTERALSQQNAINTTQSSIWLVPLENTLQNQVSVNASVQNQVSVNAPVNNRSSNGVQTLALPTTSSQVIGSLNSGPREFVILDTVEMPNTKTSSPFKYLQTLMQIHNITLLDGTERMSKDFICLIKFKLQFSQQTIHKPVVLCLSLHCLENKFFLGVKDPSYPDNIDLNKLSANWQWEILKIYTVRELVVNKLFQNAQKISPAVFGHVKNFVSVLQTIKLKTSI